MCKSKQLVSDNTQDVCESMRVDVIIALLIQMVYVKAYMTRFDLCST